MDLSTIIFYAFSVSAAGFFLVADLTGNILFRIIAKIGSIYVILFAILKFFKVL